MKKTIVFKILFFFISALLFRFLISSAWAQAPSVIEMPSSPNPVGSGSRSLGMGGAFIGVADDATAASWNPGGLIQLETPELSFVLGTAYRSEKKSFPDNPEASGSDNITDSNINYLSSVYPFQLMNRNMVVSLNYQHLYDFNRDWKFNFIYPPPTVYEGPAELEYEQTGSLYALGLAYCVQITPIFSTGITLNYWGDIIFENEWEQTYSSRAKFNVGGIPALYTAVKKEEYDFNGWNANFGFLLQVNEHLTIGGVFKTPFKADINHTVSEHEKTEFPTLGREDIFDSTELYKEEIQMPMSYGIGFAVRFSDTFTMSADIYRTHWEDYALRDWLGVEKSPISGKPVNESDVDPTTWFRLGAEYLIIIDNEMIVPVRAGLFYDPAPAEKSPDNFYGISVGTGLAYKHFIFDIAYQYRFGKDIGGSLWQGESVPMDVKEHKLYCSLIMHL